MKTTLLIFIFSANFLTPLKAQTPVSLSNNQLVEYMTRISSMLTGRAISQTEKSQIASGGQAELVKVLSTWTNNDFFVKSSRIMLQTQLGISGKTDVNFELPANLLSYLIRQNLPYSQILTANYCVDDGGNKVACDTGAPFTAGILTTRAYMTAYKGRFNLSRAGNLLRQFSCLSYPLDEKLQPRLATTQLITMFKTDQDPNASQFGNGTACYACHSQFGAHAQLFVKFDINGRYQINATGVQGAGLETGKSTETLFASHLINPSEASSESSQMFGRNVSNLQEAVQSIVSQPMFTECAVRNSIRYFLRIQGGNQSINTGIVNEISSQLKTSNPDPTFRQVVVQSLSHPFVIGSLLFSGDVP